MFRKVLVLIVLALATGAFAQEKESGIRYRKSKDIDFEALLIEGENKKADIAVVTGNLGEDDLGLLKLREDFKDFIANDAGEEVK
jgi:hypothetical protein